MKPKECPNCKDTIVSTEQAEKHSCLKPNGGMHYLGKGWLDPEAHPQNADLVMRNGSTIRFEKEPPVEPLMGLDAGLTPQQLRDRFGLE